MATSEEEKPKEEKEQKVLITNKCFSQGTFFQDYLNASSKPCFFETKYKEMTHNAQCYSKVYCLKQAHII